MRRISDSERLNYYINKFKLNTVCNKLLLGAMELFSFINGEIIYSKGSKVSHVYFLVEGKLKIYILHDNGKSVLLRFNRPLSLKTSAKNSTPQQARFH